MALESGHSSADFSNLIPENSKKLHFFHKKKEKNIDFKAKKQRNFTNFDKMMAPRSAQKAQFSNFISLNSKKFQFIIIKS